MFNRKDEDARKTPGPIPPMNTPGVTVTAKPSVLEILKTRRAHKMRQIKQLDKEIELLDHDITFVERFPQHGRMLEFIAARFDECLPAAAPWSPKE